MSRSVEEVLEFPRLLELLAARTTCLPGRRLAEGLRPVLEREAAEASLAMAEEARQYLRAGHTLGFGGLADPEKWLAKVGTVGVVLEASELLDAATLLEATHDLRQTFRETANSLPRLAECSRRLSDFRSERDAIRRAILPNGEISDDASPELKRIRASMAATREKIEKTLKAILRAAGSELQDEFITVRNDRFVIPVRSSERRKIPGVIHAASATGQTLYVEPLATVELNNKLVQLAEQEAAEIHRILKELTERLRTVHAELARGASIVAEVDLAFARGRFAREFDCCIPRFNTDKHLRLHEVRHPLLEETLRAGKTRPVPITLELDRTHHVMAISGPNTGGKTVALKTVGLVALMARAGIPAPASDAELPLFDRVLADIGDEQSIEANLSTFSAHMVNLRQMAEAATDHSLVLIDEIGTGTDPAEGSALAVALLEHFRGRGAMTIATTHHQRLKAYAAATAGVLNAAVEFDEVNLRPTYRLLLGVPGTSSGIDIAARLGLPEEIIAKARSQIEAPEREAAGLIRYLHASRDEVEALKRKAQAELAELEAERQKLTTEWVERQRKRLSELEKQVQDIVKRYEAELRHLVADVKDRKILAKLEKAVGRRVAGIRSEASEEFDSTAVAALAETQQEVARAGGSLPVQASEEILEPVSFENLKPGVMLRLKGVTQLARLRFFDGRQAEVELGRLHMKVPVGDILGVSMAPAAIKPVRTAVHAATQEVPDEINVIGCTVEDAVQRVDKYLDSAALAGKPRVRIIHGHGTGALRRGLAEFLSGHPLVEKFYKEEMERGGDAVTVVELRSSE